MMKDIFLTIIFGIIISQSFSQIINISEAEGNNNLIKLSSSAIVDINSNLELRINHDSLNIKICRATSSNVPLLDELQKFNYLLLNQKEILELLNKDLSGLTDSKRLEYLGKFSDNMSTFYDKIFENKEWELKFSAYFNEFTKLPQSEKMKFNNYYISYGIVRLNQEISDNLKVLQKTIDQKKIRIQISAYLNTRAEKLRKVHIENFDDYNLGEFYEVPRWVSSFSKEDIEAFTYTQGLANNLNKIVDGSFNEIRDLLKNNIKSFNCIESSLDHLNAVYADRENIFQENANVAISFLNNVHIEYSKFQSVIKHIKEWDGKNENALELFNVIQQEFISQAQIFTSKIDSLISKLPNDLKNSNQSITGLISEISSCKALLKEDMDKVNSILSITTRLLRPSQIVAKTGIDSGKDVFAYSINDLPEFGYINLKNTGKRSNQDQLEVLLIIRTQEDSIYHRQGVIVEKQILTLQQIGVYSESNVSIILASPFNTTDKVMLNNKFQFAPSGSLLFKCGSRKDKTWNFLEPSIGFNISTPDFDLDGVPEIGIGSVVTFLQDVLSVGLSYNTKTDNPFWFFDLSLPFSTLGLPINNIQTNANK